MTASGRANRGPKAAAGNRAALIRAAREVFAENGFEVALSSIARAAGVGQGVLYRHFPTRESLALAVFEENIVEVETVAGDTGSTVDDVLAVIVDQLTTSAAFIAMFDPTGTDDPRLLEVSLRLITLLGRKLEDPRQRGAIRPDVTASDVLIAVAMLAAVMVKTDVQSKRRVAAQAWALLERGLTCS
ncbi:helix-turn-helix domain-containing protein [Nocardia bovistercoris]|uniref:Helix-turn-helix transcriptional regulator n=1 Tax=Nocardia bovistercoris TaxID=2785916 RepID=A0A931N2B5_9NOCA|nr:helix-turn-helix transcriptional regulator [Nocardia bovistercoris]